MKGAHEEAPLLSVAERERLNDHACRALVAEADDDRGWEAVRAYAAWR